MKHMEIEFSSFLTFSFDGQRLTPVMAVCTTRLLILLPRKFCQESNHSAANKGETHKTETLLI